MKLTQVERISLAVTALALFAMAGFFLGVGGAGPAEPVTIQRIAAEPGETAESARSDTPSAQPPAPSEEITLLVNINTATVQQLQALPGIGAVKAQAIVDYREEHGPFQSVEELLEVKGIGPATLEKFREDVTVDGAESAGETASEEDDAA